MKPRRGTAGFSSLTIHHSSFTIEYVFLRIYYPDYRAIGRRLIAFEWKGRLLTSTPENQFPDAGTDRIESDHWPTFVFEIGVESLYEKELSPVEGTVLDGRDDCSDDPCYLHPI